MSYQNNYRFYGAIMRHTTVFQSYLTPEIKLRMLPVYEARVDDRFYHDYPYFGLYCSGEQALARYIIDHPRLVVNKDVIVMGCGTGATAIAAAMSGAREVTANALSDIYLELTELNADLNDVVLRYNNRDYTRIVEKDKITQDVIIMSEMFSYDYGQHGERYEWFYIWCYDFQDKRKTVLIGDNDSVKWLDTHVKSAQCYYPVIAKYRVPIHVASDVPAVATPQTEVGIVYSLPPATVIAT